MNESAKIIGYEEYAKTQPRYRDIIVEGIGPLDGDLITRINQWAQMRVIHLEEGKSVGSIVSKEFPLGRKWCQDDEDELRNWRKFCMPILPGATNGSAPAL